MRTVAIVGVGLIGGSFGLALRKAGFPATILGVSSPRSIEQALERGAIDRGVTLAEAAACSGSDLSLAADLGILRDAREARSAGSAATRW